MSSLYVRLKAGPRNKRVGDPQNTQFERRPFSRYYGTYRKIFPRAVLHFALKTIGGLEKSTTSEFSRLRARKLGAFLYLKARCARAKCDVRIWRRSRGERSGRIHQKSKFGHERIKM